MPASLRTVIVALGAALAFAPGGLPALSAEAKRPNIVVILADDMGYSDLGCFGGELTTPNLDALAGKGVRFTQFYNTARCCPTRASLLTGLYPHQAGVGHMTENRGYDGYRGTLNRESVTIAEVLRPSGYRTYMVGKWHITGSVGPNGDRSTWPLGRGFEKFYGTIVGAGSYFDPGNLCRQDKLIAPTNDPEYRPTSYYYTDALADNAVAFLKAHQAESPEKPFFLYTAFTAAHWPMHAPEALVAKYRGKFDAGYGPARQARFARMAASGLLPPGAELSPADPQANWNSVANKAWEARCMEVYAAMVEAMDTGIGRLVAQLRESGQLDNTLILFLQDNGACAETVGREKPQPPAKDPKPLRDDELQPRSQPPMQTRDGRPVRTGPGVMPGPADTYVAYGRGWANVSNTPFREYKHWTHEGGISTPLVAHWPLGIKADRAGAFERQPGHLIDIMATCIDLAGVTYPAERDGRKIKPREGVSLRPAFNGEPLARVQPLFWEHEGHRAVRLGDWKIVAGEDAPWELYNIAHDRSELHDQAQAQPERVAAMAQLWDDYAARANVLPLGAWREDRASVTTAKHFDLNGDAHLSRADAPNVANRAFTIEARLTTGPTAPDGVIVAQGGTALGYSLYVDKGAVVFLVRTNANTTYRVQGPALAPGQHQIRARLDAAGRMTLDINGTTAGPVAAKLLPRMPADALDVGQDTNAPVGDYEAPSPLNGSVERVTIDLLDR